MVLRLQSILVLAFVSSLAPHVAAADAQLWLVVTTKELAASVQPLAEHRRREGLEVVVFTGQPAEALAKHPSPAYLLLVGDIPSPDKAADRAWHIESREFPLYRWVARQRMEFYSDAMWGDLDGDGMPDIPVGRLPVRDVNQANVVVNKILAYEDRPLSIKDLQIHAWAGAPLVSPAFERMATALVVNQIKSHMPRWCEAWLMCGDPTSALCGWPRDQAAEFNRRLQSGGLLAIVGAHGDEYSWISLADGNSWIDYRVGRSDEPLESGPPTCPLVVLTCSSGNFAAEERCVTEAMVLAPGGPVAAVGATTESHPLPNSFTVRGMSAAFDARPDRLGDLWFTALRQGHGTRDLVLESLLKNLEGSIDDEINVPNLRRDCLRMYALMGDPATRIRIPKELAATITKTESGWSWQAQRPPGATTLLVDHRAAQQTLPIRPRDADRETANRLLAEANKIFSFQHVETKSTDSEWQGTLAESGELRLVAETPDGLFVAVLLAE